MSSLIDSPAHRRRHLLTLPTEVLHTIFSHLATDSLANVCLACRATGRIVATIPSRSRYDIRLEKEPHAYLYSSSGALELVIKRSMVMLQRWMYSGNAQALASSVVTVTLDREHTHTPIDVTIIVRILDTLTSLREASFIGCLESGRAFVELASQNGRFLQWTSRSLKRLDLSDSLGRTKRLAKGPRHCGDVLGHGAWGENSRQALILSPLRQFRDLVQTAPSHLALVAYPRQCISCHDQPAHSWSRDKRCIYCSEPGVCLQCTSYFGRHRRARRGSRCGNNCDVLVKLCDMCRMSFGWKYCVWQGSTVPQLSPQSHCDTESCPNCQATCIDCGGGFALCRHHSTPCKCEDVCPDCYENARCEVCNTPLSIEPEAGGRRDKEDSVCAGGHTCPYCHSRQSSP